jgi:phage regulator Rha-like protein
MKKIVKKKNESLVFNDGEFIFCDSRMVANKFEIEHNKVVKIIDGFKTRFEKIKVDPKATLNLKNPPVFIEKSKEYRGQTFNGYEMNKTAFEHIASKFKTDKAFEWQLKFINYSCWKICNPDTAEGH